MKKILLLIFCLYILPCYVYADDAPCDNSNWGVQAKPENKTNSDVSEQVWDGEEENYIYDNYGSEESPAFLNREKMNPNESDYGYGTADGVD